MRASVTANRDYGIAKIDDRLYGAFLEHLGRAIYTGTTNPAIPSPQTPTACAATSSSWRESKVPLVRYPGGNFVSAYNWEDGVGPREKRPTRLDLAWHTSEFQRGRPARIRPMVRSCGAELMLAINLGSRGLDEARNFVEYVNGPTGSYWGDLRKSHGRAEPFGVKHWCLGNEMDGPWQVGHKTADEYGRLANEVAKTLRGVRQVARAHRLRLVEFRHEDLSRMGADRARAHLRGGRPISLHMYFANRAKNTANYLALNAKLDAYIGAVAATIEFVRAAKAQQEAGHDLIRRMERLVSFERAGSRNPRRPKGWPHAPRLLEDIYNFEDVLQVG